MSADSHIAEPNTDVKSRFRASPAGTAVLWGLLILAVVLAPLLFSPWHYNTFELPKAVTVRALAGLALLALVYLPDARNVRSWSRHPLAIPSLALALILIAATLFSPDPALSLWGSYDRQFGLLTWLAPLALFAAALVVLTTPARQWRMFQVLVWSSLPVVLYALLQALGADPLAWNSDGASAVLGTLGRSNFLGAYLIMIIPLTAAGLIMASRRWPMIILLTVQLAVLVMTRARAAWLGLAGAAVTFSLLWLVIHGRRRLAGQLALLALLLLVVMLVLLLFFGLPSAWTEGGSTAARLTIWRSTIPLITARPLLGYGPDGMELAFQGVFPPELVYYQGRHLAVDRAHNLWLDTGMSAGLLGLAAFVFVLWRAGRLIWRGLSEGQDWGQQVLLAGVAAAIAGRMVELQFSFDTVGTAVIFWLLLALGVSMARRQSKPVAASPSRPRASLPLALAFIGLLLLLSVRPLLADSAYKQGQEQATDTTAALRDFVAAQRHWPVEPLYHLALGQAYWADGQPAAAVSEAVSAAQLRPDDARLWAAAGDLLARWAETDPTHLAEALAAYRRAIDLSPNTAAYHTALGLILAQSGRLSDGIAAIEQAVALDATDAVAYRHLATLYETNGQAQQAEWAAARADHWSSGAGLIP